MNDTRHDIRRLVGAFIRNRRLRKGLTQESLADRAQTSAHFLGCIERGTKQARPRGFVRLLEALDIPVRRILGAQAAGGRLRQDPHLARCERLMRRCPDRWPILLAVARSLSRSHGRSRRHTH